MAITFEVDKVAPAQHRPATEAWGDVAVPHLASGLPAELPVLHIGEIHPLLAAVHYAFAEHRPLVLSPDAVWLTIAAGVAQHVRLHGKMLRQHLVRHEGKKALEVEVRRVPATAEEWAQLVEHFADQLGAEATQMAKLLACNFSTSGPIERVAGDLVLMDAVSPFFDFVGITVCGIPKITLTGTVEDWVQIRKRCSLLGEPGGLDLALWSRSLVPIADQLVRAAKGKPDAAFFRAIYKPEHAYRGEVVSGWIGRLYPYVHQQGGGPFTRQNPLLEWPIDKRLPRAEHGCYSGPGIRTNDVPHAPSTVVITMDDRINGRRYDQAVQGGLMAVAVNDEGALEPRAGWLALAAG